MKWKQSQKKEYIKENNKNEILEIVKWGNCFISGFFLCWGFGMAFPWKKQDGKYFSIFNENSCAKISGEFYKNVFFF